MTPECPKGQGSVARPELRERIEAAIEDACTGQDDANGGIGYFLDGPCMPAELAAVLMSVVTPELERLTAEVERLEALALDKEEARQGWFAAASQERDGKLAVLAEVSRLREQLAAQRKSGVWKTELEARRAWFEKTMEWARKVAVLVPADIAGRHVEVQDAIIEALQRLATAVVLPQDAEARITALLERYWADVREDRREDAGDDAEAEQAHEVLRLFQSWGVSSSEAEAPQPQEMTQHEVLIYPGDQLWTAYCQAPKCGQWSGGGTQQHAEDWKDQHEADTLRPVVLTPQQAADELSAQGGDYLEGRSSGSERLAPRPVDPFSYQAMLTTLFRRDDGLYVCVCGEQVEDILTHFGVSDWTCKPKWARSAAQAARSEATPNPQITNEINTIGSASTPPSGGDSDTTPRVWEVGDRVHRPAWNWTGTVRAAIPDMNRYRVQWDHLHYKALSASSSMCTGEELTEVSLPSSLPQEGGTDD